MKLGIVDHEEHATPAVLAARAFVGQPALLVEIAEDRVVMDAVERYAELGMVAATLEADRLVLPVPVERDFNSARGPQVVSPANDLTPFFGGWDAGRCPPGSGSEANAPEPCRDHL